MIAEDKALLKEVGYADCHSGDVVYVDAGGKERWSNGVDGYEPRLYQIDASIMNRPWIRLGGVHWQKNDEEEWKCVIGARRMKSGSVSYLPLEQWNGGLGPKSFNKQQAKSKVRMTFHCDSIYMQCFLQVQCQQNHFSRTIMGLCQ